MYQDTLIFSGTDRVSLSERMNCKISLSIGIESPHTPLIVCDFDIGAPATLTKSQFTPSGLAVQYLLTWYDGYPKGRDGKTKVSVHITPQRAMKKL